MTETERPDEAQESEDLSQSEEKTDREEGGPTSASDSDREPGTAAGTKPTEGMEPHE
ncbi:MAG TPA: hypothetical protein VHF58_08940 [Solirubrobacterales bacterium]|nr:hypothetical protein [Solirubrobacterales bacterium]